MVAAIELGKKYAQVCVKTDSMKDAESVTKIAGTEHYRIPVEVDIADKEQLQELFRSLWKMLTPYGNKASLEYLVFCLEENTEVMRRMLLDIAQIHNIPVERVRFLDKAESFCAYVLHQRAELLAHNALLLDHHTNTIEKFLLHKRSRTIPQVMEVIDISDKTLKTAFSEHIISSVFLVGDDFEESWMQENRKLLKTGKRVFVGKNLFVKGACYRGMELKEKEADYVYLGAEKVCCNIALRARKNGEELLVPIVEGGQNWYESGCSVEVILLDEPKLEFAILPIDGKEKKISVIHLEGLPERPKKTTRLRIDVEFTEPVCASLTIKDLGFGELFAQSEMIYKGELRWD